MRRSECERSPGGFTLIEVVAALLIFSLGVLMVIRLTGSLSTELERAAILSELVVLGQESMDSVAVLDQSSLTLGSVTTSVTVRGRDYDRTVTVSASTYSPLVHEVQVTLAPSGSGQGPTHTTTSYVSGVW